LAVFVPAKALHFSAVEDNYIPLAISDDRRHLILRLVDS